MEELKVTKQNALAAHNEANQKGKALLENLFGKKVFTGNVRDRIFDFDDVLDELGIKPIQFINESKLLPPRFVTELKLEYIARAYNEGQTPDWDDNEQRKYWGWFWMDSARGVSFDAYYYDYSDSYVASRLAFLDLDNFKDAVKKFLPVFEEYYTAPLTLPNSDNTSIKPNKSLHWKDIVSVEKALEYRGETIEQFNYRTQFDTDQQRAGKELEVIAEAIRQGQKGDYDYYPWFNSARSARGFSFGDYRCAYSVSCVASRLTVDSSEKATFMGKTHIGIYDRYING
ncbi:MAG TPA: hypothetical protein VNQ80_12395 [Parapedobacter sp.]|uniref:hypothetical protein n=1 Tax=Parapedobacter sp. TaxID=1958893 RepID=UPI002C411C28|nr:hypothetical protein [Parapedobacter sp.]HWK58137.1 hypothetical protein [Parapedobacter sp.]